MMKYIRFFIVLFTCILWCSYSAVAQQAKMKDKIVLLPVQGEGLSSSDKTVFQSAIKQGLAGKYKIFSGEQVREKLEKIALTSCTSDECLEKIAIAFNGNLICRGYIENEGGNYLLSLEIKDVFTDEDIFAYTVGCTKCSKAHIIESLKKMAYSVGSKDKTESLDKIAFVGFGILEVNAEPKGAEITVQNDTGNIVGFGTSPEKFRVKAGMYKVRLKNDGYETKNLKINVFRDSTQTLSGKDAGLRRYEAVVNIDTKPSSKGINIYVDDEMAGKTPAKLNLAAGMHKVEIKNKYQIGRKTILVKDGVELTETIKLSNISKKHSIAAVVDTLRFAPGKVDDIFALYGLEYRYWLWNIGTISVEGLTMPEKDSDIMFSDGVSVYPPMGGNKMDIQMVRACFDMPVFKRGRQGADLVVGVGYEHTRIESTMPDGHIDSAAGYKITKKSLLVEMGPIYIGKSFFSELKARYIIGEDDNLGYDYGVKFATGIRF